MQRSKKEIVDLKSRQSQLSLINVKHEDFIGKSEPVKKLFNLIDKVAATDANILITGENGTGKEVIANILHQQSERRNEVFVRVDMGSLNENLFESEIFGHVKGAFTDAKEDKPGRFEVANGGTIFLDEIGNLSPSMQAKLLTVIQSQKISRVGSNKEIALNVRLICTTNADLHEMLEYGLFREDLLYRINTVELPLPALRERREDIQLLADYFLSIFSKKYHKQIHHFSKKALDSLTKYSWPGNVRELQHTIERAVIMSNNHKIEPDDLTMVKKASKKSMLNDTVSLDEMEKEMIEKALDRNMGNFSKAAKDLGLTRAALYRRIEKHGI